MAIRLLHKAPEESHASLDAAHYTSIHSPVQAKSTKWVFITGKEAAPSYECWITAVPIIIMGKEAQITEEQWSARSNKYSIAVAEPTMEYGRVLFTNFVDVAVSFQTNAVIGSGTWGYNDLTSSMCSGVRPYQVNAIELRTGVSHAPISGYEASRRFALYAQSLITKQGIKLISTNIRDWASVEDPDWKQIVIDFDVEAQPDIALALWDRLNDELQNFLEILGDKLTADTNDLISITVQWK